MRSVALRANWLVGQCNRAILKLYAGRGFTAIYATNTAPLLVFALLRELYRDTALAACPGASERVENVNRFVATRLRADYQCVS